MRPGRGFLLGQPVTRYLPALNPILWPDRLCHNHRRSRMAWSAIGHYVAMATTYQN